MEWFEPWGALAVALLLLPNVLYAAASRGGEEAGACNKWLEWGEHLGRYGCMLFMVVSFGTRTPPNLALDGCLLGLYWLGWGVFWKKKSLSRALVLSILPTLLFLERGLITGNLPLLLSAFVFGACHITISIKSIS